MNLLSVKAQPGFGAIHVYQINMGNPQGKISS